MSKPGFFRFAFFIFGGKKEAIPSSRPQNAGRSVHRPDFDVK